jgi:hypothetical protein
LGKWHGWFGLLIEPLLLNSEKVYRWVGFPFLSKRYHPDFEAVVGSPNKRQFLIDFN